MSACLALGAGPATAGDRNAAPVCAPNGGGDRKNGEQSPAARAADRDEQAIVKQDGADGNGAAPRNATPGTDSAKEGRQTESLPGGERSENRGAPCNPERARRMHELLKSLLYWPV